MANRKFVPGVHEMQNSIIASTNGVWGVELFKSDTTNGFHVMFKRSSLSSIASMWDDKFLFTTDYAGFPPQYVQEFAARMWADNVA